MRLSQLMEWKHIPYGGDAYEEMVGLRYRVLREPLGMTFEPEFLATDRDDLLLGGYTEGKLIACLLVRERGEGIVQIRQVAVADEWQGKGIGRGLMAFAEAEARKLGATEIVLNARETALEFYLRLGYLSEGERFNEIGIVHQLMRKSL